MANELVPSARKSPRRRREPPSFSFPLVRTRVFEALCRGTTPERKLTMVMAPTGYGKTVLASSVYHHFRQSGLNSYWISLDDRDHSMERLLGLLENALGSGQAEVHPTQALIHGDEPLESRVESLLAALAEIAEPSLICIDNLNYCDDETLGLLLDRLVFRTPASLYLLFSSTDEVPFNLARAKLEARVQELRYSQLSLQPDEIRDLLGAELCAQLGEDALAGIVEQTEGWPAAVRLVQIILTGAERPREALARFSGGDEDLADLLNRQVLAGFAPQTRDFLLRIAPLRSFCVELCRHATGDEQAARHLELLLKRNVFMIPLDRNRSWYRLHGLFRDFLIKEAQRQLPEASRRQALARAAEWCESGGHWQDAIDYALAADSGALAAAVLDRVAAMFVRDRGDLRQYIEWVEQLRAAGQPLGWEADYWYAWALVFHRRYETARQHGERLARRLEQELGAGVDVAELAELRRRVEVVQICIAIYTHRLAEGYQRASVWLAERHADDPFDVATMACVATIYLTGAHRFVEARQMAREAQAAIAQTGSAYGQGWVALLNTMIAVTEGDYAGVYDELKTVLARAQATLGEHSGISATVAMVCAKVAVEMNLDEEARPLLDIGLRWAHSHGILETTALGLDAALKLWSGRDSGLLSLAQFREIASSYPPALGVMLSCLMVQRLLRLGRVEEALAEAAQIGLGGGVMPRLEGLELPRARDLFSAAQIDLALASGQLKQAETLVAEATRLARAEGCIARQVELALCELAIAVCSHNPQPATRHLTRAVSLAARRRILRPFRDRGELIAGLVNDTKPQAWGFALEEERKFFIDICRGLPLSNPALLEQLGHLQGKSQLLETPTAREMELLSLIEAGLSNQQLADRLSVSVATVKWHLYNLYTKLGVSSRAAALARARSLNLLAR